MASSLMRRGRPDLGNSPKAACRPKRRYFCTHSATVLRFTPWERAMAPSLNPAAASSKIAARTVRRFCSVRDRRRPCSFSRSSSFSTTGGRFLANGIHHGNIPHHYCMFTCRILIYVPTSCSWLNLVERWFAELTSKWIRRGSFYSVDELIAAIREFLAAWNENPKPFVWTATLDSIVAKLARCRQTLEQIQPGCTAPRSRKRLSS